jgi:ADP-ribose pyrophosphatase
VIVMPKPCAAPAVLLAAHDLGMSEARNYLSTVPIRADDFADVGAPSELAWSNDFAAVRMVPTPTGPHVALGAADADELRGAAVVVFDGARVLLVRQLRWAAGVNTWELPGGGLDAFEGWAAGAARELAEETGVRVSPDEMVDLGAMFPEPSLFTCQNHVFLARVPSGTAAAADLVEVEEVFWAPVDEVVQACITGAITTGATVIAILRARLLGLL